MDSGDSSQCKKCINHLTAALNDLYSRPRSLFEGMGLQKAGQKDFWAIEDDGSLRIRVPAPSSPILSNGLGFGGQVSQRTEPRNEPTDQGKVESFGNNVKAAHGEVVNIRGSLSPNSF